MDELKKRARDKYGPPSESFPKFDTDGDGQISAEEWEAACKDLGIPKERAADLLKELDQNGDGQVRALRSVRESQTLKIARRTTKKKKKREEKRSGGLRSADVFFCG